MHHFTTLLSPGSQDCDFQVEIILRAIEFSGYSETSCLITVTNPTIPSTDVVANSLNGMSANANNMNPNQILGSLNEVANIRITEASTSGKSSVGTLLNLLSGIDAQTGGIRDLTDPDDVPNLLNTTSSTMGKVLTTQSANVDPSTATGMSSKVSGYLTDVSNTVGGTGILGTCVNTLSGVADVGSSASSNKSYFQGVQSVVNQMPDMKLKESIAGAPPFSISSGKIEVVVNNNYANSFDSPSTTTTAKGSQMQLPNGLADQFKSVIQNATGSTNNAVTVGTSVNGLSYNPYSDMKSHANVSASAISAASSSLASAATIAQIYGDMSQGKLSGVVDTTNQSSDIVQASFTPFQIEKNGTSKTTASSIDVGQLPTGKTSTFVIPANGNPDTDVILPLIYNPETDSWSNQGCTLSPSNTPGQMIATCTTLATPAAQNSTSNTANTTARANKINSARAAFSISIDLIKNVMNVLKAGNYAMLYSFGAFENAAWENYFVMCCVFMFLVFVAYMAIYLNKSDKIPLFEERINTLYERYGDVQSEEGKGLLKNIYVFYGNVRKKGMDKVVKEEIKKSNPNAQQQPEAEDEIPKWPNGYSVLTPLEERRLKNYYMHIEEHSKFFSNSKLFYFMHEQINEDVVLGRLTQGRINEELIAKPPTFFRILKVYIILLVK